MKKLLLLMFGFVGAVNFANATTCAGAEIIPATPSLPYTQSLICGSTDDINSVNATVCGSGLYLGGWESVYAWTPGANYDNISIFYSGQSWTGIMVYQGCPTSGGICIGNITGSAASKTLTLPAATTFTSGTTYYFVFDTWPSPQSPCPGTFTLNANLLAPCVAPPTGGTSVAALNPVCPSVNNTLSLTGQTAGTGQTYQWQSSTDGVTFTDIVGATSTTYVSSQTVETYYQCILTCSGLSDTSSAVFVTLNSFMDCYCSSAPSNTIDEEIYNVTVNGGSTDPLYANANGCATPAPGPGSILSRYSNFKTLAPITQAAPGQTVSYSIEQDECDGATYYNNGIGIWIDYNQNGLFTDPGELIFAEPTTSAASAAGPKIVSGSFTVPAAAATGNTVMRIVCAEGYSGASLTPCLAYGYGETEDHLITIQCPDLTGAVVPETGVCAGQPVTINGTTSFPVATISWWDAAVGGSQIGSGPSFTSGILAADTNFYVQEDFPGCPSSVRTAVPVVVTSVSVALLPIDVSCNNGNDGSFVISAINCGSAPFAFAVDGGAFGSLGSFPTDLTVGPHTVVVQDAALNESVVYNITIGDAPAPSGLVINTFNNDIADLSWNGNGSETSWNVEWGAPGFTPGSGAEIGSATATDTNYVVTGLDGNTEYDIYISANCGAGTTTGEWIMTNLTTLCDPLVAQGFCESFDADSETEACWTIMNANNDFDFWTMNGTLAPFGGVGESAQINTDFNFGANDDWLISPGLLLTGNEIMSFKYRTYSQFEPNDVRVMLSTTGTAPADFTVELASLFTVGNTVYLDSAINLSAYSGTCYIAFHVPAGGLDGWFLMIDDFCVDICTPAPGIDGAVDVCRLNGTLDLNSVITQGETNGVWNFAPNPFAITNDSLITVTAIPDGTFEAHYLVTTACTVDTTIASFTVFPESSAGTDGVLTVCKNQPINLLSGLSGLIDLGGTWYNPSNVALPSGQIISGNLPGQFNYNYIVNNGVCPNDTANIVMNILSTCDYNGLEEFAFGALAVYPNPSTGIFNISNVASGLNFSYEISDLNGRMIAGKENLNGKQVQEVNLSNVENGVYIVRVFNESGEFMTRIVKQ